MPAQYARSDGFRGKPLKSSVDSSSYHSTLYCLSEQLAARVPLVARARPCVKLFSWTSSKQTFGSWFYFHLQVKVGQKPNLFSAVL
jgi:hypothetical protein